MHFRKLLLILCIPLLFASCSRSSKPEREPATQAPSTTAATPQQPIAFEDRLWRVSKSTAVASGTLYLFRSDGSLEITSPGSTPMIGSWSRAGDGLVMVEESIRYQVDILELEADSFVIRSHNPGQPVDISMVPAAGV